MYINKDRWLLSQMDLRQILTDPSLQNINDLATQIRKIVVMPAIDNAICHQHIDICALQRCDPDGTPQQSQQQIKTIQVLNELSMWGKYQFNNQTRQRGLFVIPCTTNNELYQLLKQHYQCDLINHLGTAWTEHYVTNDNPLSQTILKHFFVAIPYIDYNTYLSDLFPKFYQQLSITAKIQKERNKLS